MWGLSSQYERVLGFARVTIGMVKLLALVALLAGCEAALGPGGESSNATPDASGGGGGGGSSQSPDAAVAPVDAPPACANNRKVFLNFDGVTLSQGSPSDATQNRVSWMTKATATVAPYRASSAERAIMATNIRARLSGTPFEVVTNRPASGPYVMIVFGGTNTVVGTPYTYATNAHDCGDAVKNDVGWVADLQEIPFSFAEDLAVGAIGWGLGLDGTTDTADCMCGWANGCSSAAGACSLSSSIATSITNGNESACQQGTQNEVAAFSTGFCAN